MYFGRGNHIFAINVSNILGYYQGMNLFENLSLIKSGFWGDGVNIDDNFLAIFTGQYGMQEL